MAIDGANNQTATLWNLHSLQVLGLSARRRQRQQLSLYHFLWL